MPLLIVEPGPDSPESDGLGRELIARLHRRRPGTFVLLAEPNLDEEIEADAAVERFGLPVGWGADDRLAARLVAVCARRFAVDALLGLGRAAAPLLAEVAAPQPLIALYPGEAAPPDASGARILTAATPAELLDRLEQLLAARLPIELAVGSGWSAEELEAAIHSAASPDSRLVLRWQGRLDAGARELLAFVARRPELHRGPVELVVPTDSAVAAPRAGLTHGPGELLASAATWRQAAGLARMWLAAPPRFSIRLKTVSRRAWIQRTVAAANRSGWLFQRLGGLLRRGAGR